MDWLTVLDETFGWTRMVPLQWKCDPRWSASQEWSWTKIKSKDVVTYQFSCCFCGGQHQTTLSHLYVWTKYGWNNKKSKSPYGNWSKNLVLRGLGPKKSTPPGGTVRPARPAWRPRHFLSPRYGAVGPTATSRFPPVLWLQKSQQDRLKPWRQGIFEEQQSAGQEMPDIAIRFLLTRQTPFWVPPVDVEHHFLS